MLKFQVDNLDGLEDPVKALYEEKDGAFQLKVEGIPTKDTKNIEDELEFMKNKLREAEKHRKEQKRIAEEAALEAARKSGDIQILEKSWQEKLAARESELTSAAEQYQQMISNMTAGAEAMKLASDLALPGSAEVLLPHIKSRLKTEVVDGSPTVRVLDKAGNPSAMTIEDLKTEIEKNVAFAPLLVGSRASGSAYKIGRRAETTVSVRSMSADEKHLFIKEHGQAKYLELSRAEKKKKESG